jgi:hypothetical protein
MKATVILDRDVLGRRLAEFLLFVGGLLRG